MLMGMGDATPILTDAGSVFETADSILTVGPMTIHGTSRVDQTARQPSAGSRVLDAILPIKTDASGKAKIFGLPPALAYTLAGLVVVGASYYGYRALAGRRRVANPSKRRRRGRQKRRAKR